MDDQKKQQKIYESINEFFIRVIKMKDSGLLTKYFRFMKKVPNHAPFNNTLVFIQNPECGYYATARQWNTRFNHTIKLDARPMVILFPFGPVEFVYDIEDTEGEHIAYDEISKWWKENGGTLDEKIIKNTIANLDNLGVHMNRVSPKEYFEKHSLTTGGFARMNFNDELSITLHPRHNESSIKAYGVLCHEIAHILLGHLGKVTIYSKYKTIIKELAKDRSGLSDNVCEVEAELVAWVVFNMFGLNKEDSEPYIATWLINKDISNLNWSDIMRVSKVIQDMGKKKMFLSKR